MPEGNALQTFPIPSPDAPAEDWFSSPVWRCVLDAVPSGLVAVDHEGTVVYFNPYAEMAVGVPAEQAVGQHFRDVFCPSLPLDRCWVSNALVEGANLRDHRFLLEHPTGARYSLTGDLTPVRSRDGSVLGAIVAVQETDAATAEPQPGDGAHAEAIVDSIADGLYTVDHEWRITSFNRAAERITGLREAEVVGQVCSTVLETDKCAGGCPLAATLQRSESLFGNQIILRSTSEHSCPVVANTAVLADRDGQAIGGIVSFRDAALLSRVQRDLGAETQFEGMVGNHPAMREVYELLAEVADSDASVLILGESGTGKEMVADALVHRSRRRDQPCVKVNCSAFPETLLESELFGHVRGAFTGADHERAGRFRHADGGTLFLDEIGEISPAAQLKLLRVLEEKEFEPLGTSATVKVDARIIAATNRDLPRLVRERRFRDDLYYRLNVVTVLLPPLRARRDDIPLLVDYFLAKYRLVTGKPISVVEPRAMDLLLGYDYPGNVRELENAIEHIFARTSGTTAVVEKLPLAIRHASEPVDGATNGDGRRILDALHEARWNRDRAARALGISRTTLWRRMKSLGIADEPEQSSTEGR